MTTRIKFFSIALAAIAFGCSKNDDPQATADESLYINEIYAAGGGDWLELYNGNNTPKDLSGYKIYDDPTAKYSLPEGTTIDARGFLVIVCDGTGAGLSPNFKLSSTGEAIFLENRGGELIDQVVFPPMADGQSYGRFPDGSTNFLLSGSATRGASNGQSNAVTIQNVSRSPLVPAIDQPVTITAEVPNFSAVSAATLYYRINGAAFSSQQMSNSGSTFSAVIPAANTTGAVDYYVQVERSTGEKSVSPYDAPDGTYTYLLNTDVLPMLFINEFMAENTSCCPDVENGVNEFDDWIEVYNAGSDPVDIADFYFSDDLSNPFNARIKNTNSALTTILPGGYLVVWADNDSAQGELHLDFALSKDGEAVGLFYKDGRTIDSYTFGPQSANVSFGRESDGASSWKAFPSPTPGQANQ